MLKPDDLATLYRELRHEKVLSIYVDGRTNDFSERHLWKKRLGREVAEARKRVNGTAPEENGAFDRALRHLDGALAVYDQFLPDHGWVGFATSDRLVHTESVRVPMPDLVRWEEGIRVAPYVRALKQDRLVVAVLVDSRRARIFEYRNGELTEPLNLNADTFLGDLTDMKISKRATDRSGVRGKTGTDAAQRFLGVGSERMLKELMELVADRAGSHGLLVIGGTQEAVSAAVEQVPPNLGERTIQRPGMSLEIGDAEVREILENAASQLNQTLQAKQLDEVFNQARSGGRGALGQEPVEKALEEGRVDTLLLSRSYIQGDPDAADRMVRAALEQHAGVEELSFESAERLDAECGGVGARLRYALPT